MIKKKIAILISGRGSNMRALLSAMRDPDYPAQPVLVISNVVEAPGLSYAAAEGIKTTVVAHKDFKGKPAFEAALDAALRNAHAEIICLAGFMRVLSAEFVEKWRGRILNIHPSLLPAFPGLEPQAQALAAGVAESGASVHVVTAGVDSGPVLGQARVPVLAGDTVETLSVRILEAEHRLYPAIVYKFCLGTFEKDLTGAAE